jgi:SpoIID/LytB domain protein
LKEIPEFHDRPSELPHLNRVPRHITILILGALVAALVVDVASARPLRVGVLRSASSIRVSGWVGAWETDGSIQALRSLGLEVVVLYDRDLEHGRFQDVEVLVVPNARCVPREAARRVKAWVERGGRLLATGMAAYRDGHNRLVGPANDFQWADLYGADFQRWLGAWPFCEYLALDARLAAEVGAVMRQPSVHRIELGRNTAMLVRARKGASVLATWLDADGKTPTTDSGNASAAIVQDGRTIYCGENLLAPELSRSPQVIGLVLALLRRLSKDAPLTVPPTLLEHPAALVLPAGPSVKVAPSAATIRVGLIERFPRVEVTARGGVDVVSPDGKGALTYDRVLDETTEALRVRPNGACKATAFRGRLEWRDGEMTNLLSIEEYVAGVVPNETPAVYPAEALKTMAVIARTFALSRRGYHRSRGYDVCNTVDCQMYGGYLTEWNNCNEAVNATRGQVILYRDALADSTFHAVCGGVGENVERVWPQPPEPYLVGGPDGPSPLPDLSSEAAFAAFLDHPPDSYCSTSPRFRWRESYTLPQLQALFETSLPVTLRDTFHGLGTLRSVQVIERSPLGRVLKMQIDGTAGTYVVEKDRIRWLWSGGRVGQGGLQSTLFRILPQPDGSLVFAGGGWGHGVGMCQEGAAGMATRGQDYRAIILHYYPNTSVAPLPRSLESPPPSRGGSRGRERAAVRN